MTTMALDIRLLLSAPLLARAEPSKPDAGGEGEPGDAELIRAARGGDPRAMQALYQRHAQSVYARLTRLVGPVPEREDLMQEVFMALFQRLDAYRGEAQLNTYLQRIAANKAYDHLRRSIKRRQREVLPSTSGDVAGSGPSPERVMMGGERTALLWQCLDRLKPKKRIAFVLRVVEGLSLKEISMQTEASVPAVAQRIRHARMELTEMVRQAEDKEDGK